MKILVIVMILMLALFLVMYYLYCLIFCHPLKKRPNVHRIPESNPPVKPVYLLIKPGAHLFGRFDLEEASPLEAVKNQKFLFCLFMKKERLLIEKAEHANCALTDYETYEKTVMRFLIQ